MFRKLLLFFAVSFFVLGDVSTVFAGFGITPPYVRNDKLTQGSSYTQEIILVRGDPVEDLKAEITLLVPDEIKTWFTIDRGNEFLLPKGEKQVPMRVTVTVPPNAAYEHYEGAIRVRTTSPDPASGVSIALGAQIDVDIRVVDEIRDFEVKRVKLSEAEEPTRFWWLEYPGKVTFTMGIENTGNAPTAPSRVQLDVYDKRGNVVLETMYNSNSLDEVLPFETREVVAYLPTRLPPGAYLVRYSIFRFEDEVKRSGELTLSVLPTGTLSAYTGYGIEGLSRGDLMSVVVPIATLLLLLIAAILVARMRNGRKHRKKRVSKRRSRDDDEYDEPPAPRRRSAPPRRAGRAPQSHGPTGVVDLSGRRRAR
jgi:hypothetical protein